MVLYRHARTVDVLYCSALYPGMLGGIGGHCYAVCYCAMSMYTLTMAYVVLECVVWYCVADKCSAMHGTMLCCIICCIVGDVIVQHCI